MDGTLINSGTIISNTINHVRINSGLEAMPKDILLENINNPHINPAEFFYETKEFTPRYSKLFEEYYDAHCIKLVELYDGIEELLSKLKDDKYTLSIATNASNEFAVKTTKYLDIYNYFDYIVGYDDVINPKPDADMIDKTMFDLGFEESNCLLVGDSHKDLYAAQNANIDAILVNWGFSDHSDDGCNTTLELYEEIKRKTIVS
jgi:phosphoglycolate phosphatase